MVMPLTSCAPASRATASRATVIRTDRIATSEPILVLDDLPVSVFGADLAAAERVDVAALVVQVLAGAALTPHRPHRDRAIAGEDVLLVVPTHVGNHLEAIRERLADHLAPFERAADRLRPTRQPEGGVFGEERGDAVDVAAVEGSGNRLHQFRRGDVILAGGAGVRHAFLRWDMRQRLQAFPCPATQKARSGGSGLLCSRDLGTVPELLDRLCR